MISVVTHRRNLCEKKKGVTHTHTGSGNTLLILLQVMSTE